MKNAQLSLLLIDFQSRVLQPLQNPHKFLYKFSQSQIFFFVVSYRIVVVRKGCQLLKIVQGIENNSYYIFSSWFHFKLNLIFDPDRLALYHSKLMTWQCSEEVHMLVKHIHSYLYNLDYWKAMSPSYWIKPWYCWHIHSLNVYPLLYHLDHIWGVCLLLSFLCLFIL